MTMPSAPPMMQALEAITIGVVYIAFSAGLITFNKFMLQDEMFPHALHLTVVHMSIGTIYSVSLCSLVPSIYPTMGKALENRATTLKYIAPLGLLFAFALWSSNKAYQYCSVAFLQFCKEGNVALIFFMSCAAGRQTFSWTKLSVLAVVMAGCSICAEGEMNFVLVGFLLQIASQFCECSKNLMGEIIMSGAGLKLDPLTFVAFQSPCSLAPLLLAVLLLPADGVFADFQEHWPLLLANATVAFMLNVLIALTLKRLSALAFVIIGLAKDIVIVCASSAMFGDPISDMQRVGFVIALTGMAGWATLKMRETAETNAAAAREKVEEDEERQGLLQKKS
eukprot:CAMPEP_0197649276 /NCGR_PEP_ID=MMETSP1338-20131121/28256_1 /TAXON_ID=43686 ORGANISM="Pelagodinium beii, Strain RCC1491" /NCGR_SAMPLE_ID=MMETSP1338 /ASSEMBLY_ACC=CAM_ASM_000754 /LENGTH=336 /DNA_ID=CAMNT_0043223425 /DNA_START=74 /DNA_END=1084 /DNA_ORIENTATION=+